MKPILLVILQTGNSFLFAHEKSYTPVVVLMLILTGLIGYVWLTNRRIAKIEKEIHERKEGNA